MESKDLRSRQAPLKERFRREPEAARVTLTATGRIDRDDIVCRVKGGGAAVKAGLHPASGGSSETVCSGDMLLEALAACAGVTLKAVATALDIELKNAAVRAEGDLDFRGALGVAPEAPVGFTDVRLHFELDCDASETRRKRLIELTERYCIIYQTLRRSPRLALETHLVPPGQAPSLPGLNGVEDAAAAQRARLDALSAAAAHAL